jgi:4-aminobutyrate aminotransferase-like enzyme
VTRCGDLFAINHEDVVPDIITLSKTLGNGIPLSAVVTSNEIDRVCKEKDFLFYTTHINDPLPAAVGDNIVENSRARGRQLHAGLKKLKERYGCIGDVRGRGLMAGVEIVSDRETKGSDTDLGRRLGDRMMELGLWAQLSSHKSFNGVFRIAPPIVITESQVADGLKILEEAFATTEGSCPLY